VVHPEKHDDEAKLYPIFGFADEFNFGPKIKDYMGGNSINKDKGLYLNSEELAKELEEVFQSCLVNRLDKVFIS